MALLDKLKSRSKEQAAEASDGASAPTQSSLASSLLSKLKMKPSADDGKADKAYDPLRTVSILDRIRPQTEGGASRPLPLIGHLPARRQIEICLYTMLIFIALFAITTFMMVRSSGHDAAYRATSTEMQMLSQRMARSSAQAIQGNAEAFPLLSEAYTQFDTDLTRLVSGGDGLPASKGQAAEILAKIKQNWDTNFRPNQKKPTVETILKQRETLVSVTQNVSEINRNDAKLLELTQQLVSLLGEANASSHELELANQQVMLSQRMAKNANAMLAGEIINPEVVFLLGKDTNTFRDTLAGMIEGSEELRIPAASNPEVKEKLVEIRDLFKDFETVVGAFSRNMQNLVNTRLANQTIYKESETLLKDTKALTEAYESQASGVLSIILEIIFAALAFAGLYGLIRVYNAESQRRRAEIEAENKRNQEAILRLLNEMSDLADGDLTVRASVTEDLTGAIADSMNYTIDELRSLIIGINRATDQVTAASQQAQAISGELLQAAQRQSEEIIDTNEVVQNITRSINEVSGTTVESARVARQSLEAANKGTEAVQNQIKGMNEIREQIQETAKRIKRLGESSQEITEIVELISDITEQTNVLALNAAIQAASAGEAGRGFTVVAEEVQRLAERSGEATKQIGAIVKTIQADTHDAVAAMEISTQGVVEGAKLSDAAGQALNEIGQVSNELAGLIQTIAHATESQQQLADKVAVSMQDILRITEQTTAGTKQTAVQIGQLTGLAAELKGSVAGFKL
ncbi:methyl-accepting chemotaxis protein [Chitinimonas taiwanensis]|jgi:twitching motility protein PilJ|uniref:Twitching motility protein PilJ n=2 Tax=Chitinimonas TaxID=240411 RepID=A0A1K2HNN8_9NEIS|nr:methyl-accepting chemotaxis protein [Chitinimonas taiwanensis]SFZ78363.1 twitching motility protein PilJ [Chitinimonas taiwanensis DSM 18899]